MNKAKRARRARTIPMVELETIWELLDGMWTGNPYLFYWVMFSQILRTKFLKVGVIVTSLIFKIRFMEFTSDLLFGIINKSNIGFGTDEIILSIN